MALAQALRKLIPAGYHVREESAFRADDRSLPEPDVAVVSGGLWDYLPSLPPLGRLALAVEVDHHSHERDHVEKLAKYAAAGVPEYWVVEAEERAVVVYRTPGPSACYDRHQTYRPGEEVEVVIGGHACGRLAVADFFPPGPQVAAENPRG
jgi:Uma2 family endonuclease